MITRKSTKEIIAESFIELSAIKNVNKITINDIVKNCELTKTTFYNHFQDKYDLFVWIYAEPIKNIVAQIDNENYKLRNAIFDVISHFADNRKFIINAIMYTAGHNSFLNHVSKIHFSVLQDFIKSKHKLNELPLKIEVLLKLWAFGTAQVVCEWLINKMSIPIEKLTTYLELGLPEGLR